MPQVSEVIAEVTPMYRGYRIAQMPDKSLVDYFLDESDAVNGDDSRNHIASFLALRAEIERRMSPRKDAASLLRSALGQSIPSDDKIILEHVREALQLLEEVR